MTPLRWWVARHIAVVLLILALITILAMRWLYSRRVIGYPAAGHLIHAARILRYQAGRFTAQNH